jgi:hypothetical protein
MSEQYHPTDQHLNPNERPITEREITRFAEELDNPVKIPVPISEAEVNTFQEGVEDGTFDTEVGEVIDNERTIRQTEDNLKAHIAAMRKRLAPGNKKVSQQDDQSAEREKISDDAAAFYGRHKQSVENAQKIQTSINNLSGFAEALQKDSSSIAAPALTATEAELANAYEERDVWNDMIRDGKDAAGQHYQKNQDAYHQNAVKEAEADGYITNFSGDVAANVTHQQDK